MGSLLLSGQENRIERMLEDTTKLMRWSQSCDAQARRRSHLPQQGRGDGIIKPQVLRVALAL